jgi:hypothetical protein
MVDELEDNARKKSECSFGYSYRSESAGFAFAALKVW